MPSWDEDGYAARVVRKIFVPRSYYNAEESDITKQKEISHNDWTASCLAMIEQK
jgi:hypothetical protein